MNSPWETTFLQGGDYHGARAEMKRHGEVTLLLQPEKGHAQGFTLRVLTDGGHFYL